jgi:GGDEF domain-containing protein
VRCALKDGQRHVESLGAAIEANRIIHGAHDIGVRASIGIEAYGPDSDLETLMHRADAAMYRRKRHRARAAA